MFELTRQAVVVHNHAHYKWTCSKSSRVSQCVCILWIAWKPTKGTLIRFLFPERPMQSHPDACLQGQDHKNKQQTNIYTVKCFSGFEKMNSVRHKLDIAKPTVYALCHVTYTLYHTPYTAFNMPCIVLIVH